VRLANLTDTLKDEAYKVAIRTSFEPGTLKVGEIVIPGESEETFVIVAHLCHPAMSRRLERVVAALAVAHNCPDSRPAPKEQTRKSAPTRSAPTYTYVLILPGTIGSVAYLSHHEG
jgi:aminopeptidase-like protein